MTVRRLSVFDAAEHLGVSVNAVRLRVRRGTLDSDKDGDGNVWVLVEDYSTDDSQTTRSTSEPTSNQVDDLREQVSYLREIISIRDEELRRKDTIIMQMAQRIGETPELEAAEHRERSEGGVRSDAEPTGKGDVPEDQDSATQEPTEAPHTAPDTTATPRPTLRERLRRFWRG